MFRGSPVLSGSLPSARSSISYAEERALKRPRTQGKISFKPPSRLASTLPRFLAGCPAELKQFTVKFINILIPRQGQLVKDELWIQYVCEAVAEDTTGEKAADVAGRWVVGTIINPETRFWEAVQNCNNDIHKPDLVVDGGGSIVASGFVDIQLNGAFGVDFTSETVKADQVHKVSNEISLLSV